MSQQYAYLSGRPGNLSALFGAAALFPTLLSAQCITSVVNPSCPGLADASITALYGDGSQANKKYVLHTGGSAKDSAVSAGAHSFTGLAAGTWETRIFLADTSGAWAFACSTTDTIADPEAIVLSTGKTNVLCRGDSTGAVDLDIAGGTAPYSYLWTTGETTQDISGKGAGSYTVVVSDVRGCLNTASVTLTQPATAVAASYTSVDLLCHGNATGSINLSASGGYPPYTFLWSNGATTEDLNGLSGGDYSVEIRDSSNCPDAQSIAIYEPPKFSVAGKGINISCNGLTDGKAHAGGMGGTPPYSYLWATGETTDTIYGLEAGRYIVIGLDANGCASYGEASLIEPTVLNAVIETEDLGCDRIEYKVEAFVSGGTLPYSFTWSDGSTSKKIEDMAPGDYTVTISDGGSCAVTDTLSLAFVDVTCLNIPNGFTPNGDGTNDVWNVRNFEKHQDATIRVFDIHGRVVFDSSEHRYPWNGTHEGRTLPAGTYYYIIDLNDGAAMKTGPVTILR